MRRVSHCQWPPRTGRPSYRMRLLIRRSQNISSRGRRVRSDQSADGPVPAACNYSCSRKVHKRTCRAHRSKRPTFLRIGITHEGIEPREHQSRSQFSRALNRPYSYQQDLDQDAYVRDTRAYSDLRLPCVIEPFFLTLRSNIFRKANHGRSAFNCLANRRSRAIG